MAEKCKQTSHVNYDTIPNKRANFFKELNHTPNHPTTDTSSGMLPAKNVYSIPATLEKSFRRWLWAFAKLLYKAVGM